MSSNRAGRFPGAVMVLGVALLAGLPALAHHSYSMFDDTKAVILQGTVKEWRFTKPHTWLILTVDADGKSDDWAIEGPTTNGLLPAGWNKNTFKPGDQIKIEINPLRDGRNGGAFLKATLPDGRVLTHRHAG